MNSMLTSENRARLARMKATQQRRSKRNELRGEILTDILGFFGGSRSNTNDFVSSTEIEELEAEGRKVVEEVKKNGFSKRQKLGIALITTAVVGALAYTFFKKK